LPEWILTPIALWSKVQGKLTGRAALLNDQRVVDMRQRSWLCSGDKAAQDLGFEPQKDLDSHVKETAGWYMDNGWM
jgi:UDP-glucose 4-epimerase